MISITVAGCGCQTGGTCTAPSNCALTATAQLSNGTSQAVTTQAQWSSTNPSVAAVAGNGTVTVQNAGQADLTAVYQGKLAGVTLTVPAPWSQAGNGNFVFDMPTYVSRVRIQGRWNGRDTSNFVVTVAGRLVVNEILRQSITYDGTHQVSGGVTQITDSNSIAWSFTQLR